MKRFKIVGLCLVAVFALTAVMASGAQAGQWGNCVKAKKEGKTYLGHYSDKLCSTKVATGGKYEWEAYKGAPIPFTSEGGVSHLKGGPGEITCKHGTDSGVFLNATQSEDTFKFFECELAPFGLKCKSYGAAEGEIVTYVDSNVWLDHGEKGLSGGEPAAGEVWQEVFAKGENTSAGPFGKGPWLATFECGGIPFAVTGSVSGVVNKEYVEAKLKSGKAGKKGKPGKPTLKVTFGEKVGEQDLKTTLANPLKGNEIETVASVQEGLNEIIIDPLPKGLELDSI